MFDILRVDLNNFKSFRGEHVIEFPKRPGLYYLTGENLDNPRLGPNGIGKSTVLDAIRWCFYGATSRGLKAGDIVTWGEKFCCVTVYLKGFTVQRTQNHNSLTLMDERGSNMIDQAALEKKLRLTPEQFDYAIMMPQFGESFFDLTANAKLTLLSKILGLDYWLDKSREANELADEILKAKTHQEQVAARTEGQVTVLHADVHSLTTRIADFEANQKLAVEGLISDLAPVENWVNQLVNEISDLERVLLGIDGRLPKLLSAYNQRGTAISKIGELEGRLLKLHDVGATCPTCLQAVSATHLLGERTVLEKQIAGLRDVAKALEPSARDYEVVSQNKDDFGRKLAVVRMKLANKHGQRSGLQERIATEQGRANPYSHLLKEKEESLAALTVALGRHQERIATLSEEHTAVSFWVSGFKRVRLFIVEETLRQLEVEVNNNLASLGLVDWRVQFDVERENKSGTVTKGFVVLVYVPNRADPVRLEAWSGGETQRLRLAGDLGVANLIMERAGLVGKVEFYDEPSNHLSDEGLLDLADTLHDRATALGKRIWLVDHRLMDHPFTGVMLCRKDQFGTRLERIT